MIDCEELLHGNPTWEQVVEYFKEGAWDDEVYLVEAIEKHLQTEEQRKQIFDARLSIEKMLNGRYGSDKQEILVNKIFKEWNTKLGFKSFLED